MFKLSTKEMNDVSNAAEKAENADSIGTEMEGIEEQSDCDFIAHGALEEDEDSNGTNQSADEEIPGTHFDYFHVDFL
uniref:Uncharacterized protein n=1 Tax=Caenorhabditis japonica TaxID=281687 RepID=A0A8R1EKU3_CAEJA